MGRKFNIIIEKDEDGIYVGTVHELPGCRSQANSEEKLLKNMKEAIELYLSTMDSEEIQELDENLTELMEVKQITV